MSSIIIQRLLLDMLTCANYLICLVYEMIRLIFIVRYISNNHSIKS